VVTVPGAGVRVTYRLDVRLLTGGAATLAEPRVQVHLGTRDSPARVADLTGGRAQLRLERPLLARAGDRVVVRRIAPPDTLGGGVVLDPSPPRHGPDWEQPTKPEELAAPAPALPPTRAEPGPLARRVLAALEADGFRPRGPAQLADDLDVERRAIEAAFGELAAFGEVVRAKQDVVFAADVYRELAHLILTLVERNGSTSIAEVRDALSLSRKYAQALLEQLDAERRLRREGDRHFPRQRSPG
jgi:selenocysteine-specific elongation factor